MGDEPRIRPKTNPRGQSSVIGFVLVVAITIMGIIGILFAGTGALQDAQTRSEVNAAEHAMTQLDSKFSLVALGQSSRQGTIVTLRSGASMSIDGDSGWMNVSVFNRTSGSLEFEVLNTTMGAVVYENEGTTIAYQGGGVWKLADSGGSSMVSPPEFHYRTTSGKDPTLTLPLVVVQGGGTTGERTVAEVARTTANFPTDMPSRSNPLERGEVKITVQSRYYEAWGSFFEERTDGDVSYEHDDERVSVTLRIQATAPGVEGGIVSGANGVTLTFGDQAEADSFNSSEGDYSATNAENTSIVAAGSVDLLNHATLFGDLVTGGSVTLENKAEITGDLTYGGTLTNIGGTIGGDAQKGANVPVLNSVGWLIDETHAEFESSNDNSGAAAIDDSSETLTGCLSTCTLNDGDYILENVSLGNNEELVLDTSGGNVEVAVRDDINIHGDGKIRVTGGGTARIYVVGDVMIMNGGNVTVPDQRSPGLWIYMNPGTEATIKGQGLFVGVIYGPGNGAQNGVEISLIDQAEIFGGVVGTVDTVPNGIGIHFDEALTTVDPLMGAGGDRPPVTYMHVSENRINVTDR